jgi:hypothetical protein
MGKVGVASQVLADAGLLAAAGGQDMVAGPPAQVGPEPRRGQRPAPSEGRRRSGTPGAATRSPPMARWNGSSTASGLKLSDMWHLAGSCHDGSGGPAACAFDDAAWHGARLRIRQETTPVMLRRRRGGERE